MVTLMKYVTHSLMYCW